jgi:hypothetical protein
VADVSINKTTPVASALKLEAPTDFLNHFLTQVAVSIMKPPQGGFGSKTGVSKSQPFQEKRSGAHSPTDTSPLAVL